MQLSYKSRKGTLDEYFIADEGYEAPVCEQMTRVDEGVRILLFVPEHSNKISSKVIALESLLNDAVKEQTHALLMMPYGTEPLPTKVFTCKEDKDNECADDYGVLSGEGVTALSLFVIAKDNNIYHRQVLGNEEEMFKEKSFLAGISQAINSFTGVGCHG